MGVCLQMSGKNENNNSPKSEVRKGAEVKQSATDINRAETKKTRENSPSQKIRCSIVTPNKGPYQMEGNNPSELS